MQKIKNFFYVKNNSLKFKFGGELIQSMLKFYTNQLKFYNYQMKV